MNQPDFFEQFPQLNILIIGDVMIDRYLNGSVDRISPEAPVPVVHLKQEDNRLGGAANVALNIKAMGATPYLFSVIGDDQNGRLFKELLPASEISSDYLLQSSERITTVKTRVLSQSQQLIRVDREDTTPLTNTDATRLLQELRLLLDSTPIHLILFQDYNKGVLTPEIITAVTQEALTRDIPTAVDPKYHNFWAYKNVTLFKPNLRETQQQVDPLLRPELDSLKQATTTINQRLDNTLTMITLSDKGLFISSDQYTGIIPTQARTIADVCGAGDTVISIVALGLACGMDIKNMALLANLAGGQVCEKVGVVPINKNQLQEEYKQYH